MKPIIGIVLASLLACTAIQTNAADKVTTTAVQFARGSNGATLQGNFSGYGGARYTLSARAGQMMQIRITGSSNANFNVFAPGDIPGSSTALGRGDIDQGWSGRLPADGTYMVQVYQGRNSARRGTQVPYEITFEIR